MLTNNNHPVQSLNGLNLLRTEKKLCDVTIKAEDAMFHAHRAVLASSSPYFFAMFCRDMKETGNPSVTIHDVPAHVMEAIINYCYTATIEVNEDNVQELLPAACLFQLTWVRDACCDFLKEQLCPSNCLGVKGFADAHSCTDLCLAASNFAQQHFIDIIECEEFLELLPRQLIDLLKSEELNVQNEEKVYESVMKWVKHDPSNRQQYLADLLKHVRLPLVDRNFLVSIVGTEPLIRQIEACRDLLDEAKDYLLLPEQREKFEGPRTRHRKPKMSNANQTLFAIGGWCNGNAISTVEKYNPPKDEWIQMGDMAKRRCGVGIAVLNNSIFAIGGHDGTSYLNSIEKYDLLTDLWSSNVAPTSACRTSVGVAVLNGQIYAVGGQDGISCLNLVECYDPGSDCWSQVSPMSTRRLGVAIGVLDGCLYAVGGSNGMSPLNTVERYDPKTNQWMDVAPMKVKRKHLGVAVINDELYSVGGRDDSFELSSVERYDPRMNRWCSVVAMNERRSGLGMCVLNGKLYAVGGFNGSNYLKSVEWLNMSEHQWKYASPMNYKRLGCGVAVLNLPYYNH